MSHFDEALRSEIQYIVSRMIAEGLNPSVIAVEISMAIDDIAPPDMDSMTKSQLAADVAEEILSQKGGG